MLSDDTAFGVSTVAFGGGDSDQAEDGAGMRYSDSEREREADNSLTTFDYSKSP